MNASKAWSHFVLGVVVGLVLLTSAQASAQLVNSAQLAKVSAIRVTTDFSFPASDNYTLRASVLKTEAELVLRRSGISVAEEDYRHTLEIGMAGVRLPNRICAVAYTFNLWRVESLEDRSVGAVYSFSNEGVITGATYNLQVRLRNTINQQATALANEILRARQEQ